jgi:hypothetical protein
MRQQPSQQQAQQQGPATAAPRVPQQRAGEASPTRTGWAGWVVFAAIMMIILGAFQAIAGFVALFDPGYYVVGANGFVVHVNYTAWGWTHLVVGLVALAAGFGLFTGAMWARVLGIVVAGISAIVNFAFIPAYPLWSLIMITLDVVIIYAIAAHGQELKLAKESGS